MIKLNITGTTKTPEGIDPEIRPLVEHLNKHGIPTFTSCQGGDNHGFGIPTIGIPITEGFDKIQNKLTQILNGYPYTISHSYAYSTSGNLGYEAAYLEMAPKTLKQFNQEP